MKIEKAIKAEPWSYREKKRFAFHDKFKLKDGDTVTFFLESYIVRERYVKIEEEWKWKLWEINVNGEWREYFLNGFFGTSNGTFGRVLDPEFVENISELAKRAKRVING